MGTLRLVSDTLGCVLRGRMPVDAQSLAYGIGCLALGGSLGNLLPKFNPEPRAADFDAPGPRTVQTCLCPVANPFA